MTFGRYLVQFLRHKAGLVAFLIFAGLTMWRVSLLLIPQSGDYNVAVVWGASYQLMAFWGAVAGLWYVHLWGGWKSVMGRANLSFAIGLCLQLLGQSVSSWYFYHGEGVPYPSVGDIGFFGSVLFYTYGAFLLAKVAGAHISLRSYRERLIAVLLPLIMLWISSSMFLRGYEFDWSQPLTIFLDFAYPLGQAFYVSIALLAYLLTRNVLGGIMRSSILLFIAALVAQYIADFVFLLQSHQGTYVAGGIDDYLYLFSYFLMTSSLIQLAITFERIKNS